MVDVVVIVQRQVGGASDQFIDRVLWLFGGGSGGLFTAEMRHLSDVHLDVESQESSIRKSYSQSSPGVPRSQESDSQVTWHHDNQCESQIARGHFDEICDDFHVFFGMCFSITKSTTNFG